MRDEESEKREAERRARVKKQHEFDAKINIFKNDRSSRVADQRKLEDGIRILERDVVDVQKEMEEKIRKRDDLTRQAEILNDEIQRAKTTADRFTVELKNQKKELDSVKRDLRQMEDDIRQIERERRDL